MLALAFLSLGLLIGVLAGLSNSPVVSGLIAALFAFSGGTILKGIGNSPERKREFAGALLCFSSACLVGAIGGIVVKENRLLTLPSLNRVGAKSDGSLTDYLKSERVEAFWQIRHQYRSGEISASNAYERTLELFIEKNTDK